MVNVVKSLRQSRVSMAWTGMQGLYRMARHPKVYLGDIAPHASNTAVLVVDGINSFLHQHGSLFMKNVSTIFPRMNKVINAARHEGMPVFYVNDNHKKSDQELQTWPKHSPKWSWEAQVHKEIAQPQRRQEIFKKSQFSAFRQGTLTRQDITEIFGENSTAAEDFFVALDKGTDKEAFLFKPDVEDKIKTAVSDPVKQKKILALLKHYEEVNPHARLQKLGVKKLYVLGVATEYCDEANSVDGVKLGYEVVVVNDSIRAVDLTPGDGDRAVYRMFEAGVKFMDTVKVVDKIQRREYRMPFDVPPTNFAVGPSRPVNARPIVDEEIVGRQAEFVASLEYRKESEAKWFTQTDFYQLVMTYLFNQVTHFQTPIAHFEGFIRKLPFGRQFMIFSGLRESLLWLKTARMNRERIEFVMRQPIIRDAVGDKQAFRDYLENLDREKLKVDIWAFPEGAFYTPGAIYMSSSGPLDHNLLLETALLSFTNSRSAYSSNAALYALANPDLAKIAMEMRRMDARLSEVASLEAWLQGFMGTSNTEAAYQYELPMGEDGLVAKENIPPIGTNSHAAYLAFAREMLMIQAWMEIFPQHPMVLIDTFHALINALKTADVLKGLGKTGTSFRADSRHLNKLMELYERILKDHGLQALGKIGTGDLTPDLLAQMREQEAIANIIGTGTKLGEVPATPGVFKFSQMDGPNGARYGGKRSIGSPSLAGIHQTWREFDKDGHAVGDNVTLLDEEAPGIPMLRPYTSGGLLLDYYPGKLALRAQYAVGRNSLPKEILAGDKNYVYPVTISARAQALAAQVEAETRAKEIDPFMGRLLEHVTPEELRSVGLLK